MTATAAGSAPGQQAELREVLSRPGRQWKKKARAGAYSKSAFSNPVGLLFSPRGLSLNNQ